MLVALALGILALRCGSSEVDPGNGSDGKAGTGGAAGSAGSTQTAGISGVAGASQPSGCRLGGATVEPTFDGIKAIFRTSCVGCHNGSMSNLVDLRDNAGLPERLTAPLGTSTCAGRTLVVAADSEESLLPAKLRPAPPCGARMPNLCMNTSCLSDACVEVITNWIDAGAPM